MNRFGFLLFCLALVFTVFAFVYGERNVTECAARKCRTGTATQFEGKCLCLEFPLP